MSYYCYYQLIKEERCQATASLVDVIMGDIQFHKPRLLGGLRIPCSMLTADNEPTRTAYKNAKEDRLRQEKELVHGPRTSSFVPQEDGGGGTKSTWQKHIKRC
jgi:hypothetical protein